MITILRTEALSRPEKALDALQFMITELESKTEVEYMGAAWLVQWFAGGQTMFMAYITMSVTEEG